QIGPVLTNRDLFITYASGQFGQYASRCKALRRSSEPTQHGRIPAACAAETRRRTVPYSPRKYPIPTCVDPPPIPTVGTSLAGAILPPTPPPQEAPASGQIHRGEDQPRATRSALKLEC